MTGPSKKHPILMYDRDTRTGICEVCGAVEVRIRWLKREQRESIHCRTYVRSIQKPGSPNWGTRNQYAPGKRTDRVRRLRYRDGKINSHGLTLLEARKRLVGATCEICGDIATVNDHCHDSGGLRGTLCRSCNLTLGMASDDPVRLRAAADYLDRYRTAGGA